MDLMLQLRENQRQREAVEARQEFVSWACQQSDPWTALLIAIATRA